jgi:hypothetical protein
MWQLAACRPVDWAPLSAADPVPGDPYEVAALGQRFQATAQEISTAAQRLRTMCTDVYWDSGAGEAFREQSLQTAGKLDAAFGRYSAAAKALGTNSADSSPSTAARPNYAGALDQAQAMSLRALPSAQDAATTQQTTLFRLRTEYRQWLAPDSLLPDASGHLPPPLPLVVPGPAGAALEADIMALVRRYNTAADTIATSRGMVTQAAALRDEAAANAAGMIEAIIGSDGLKDTFWDRFTNFIDEHAALLEKISEISGWVATIAGTLALVVGWIPLVGQALAAVLGTVALAASVVTLLSDSLLKLGGEGSWADIALDVVGVASFGLGRAAVGALKDSTLLARVVGKLQMFKVGQAELMESEVWLRGGEETLQEALPTLSKDLDDSVGDVDRDEAKVAKSHAPGKWPKWGDIGRGFSPAGIVRDGFKDVGDLKLDNWKALLSGKTWKDAKFFLGDPEIHEAVESLEKIKAVADEPSVKSYLTKVTSNHNMWRFVTTPAIAADYTNHFLMHKHLRDHYLHDVGLGWAAGASG